MQKLLFFMKFAMRQSDQHPAHSASARSDGNFFTKNFLVPSSTFLKSALGHSSEIEILEVFIRI